MMYAGSKNQLVKYEQNYNLVLMEITLDFVPRVTGMSKVLEIRDIEELSDSWLR